MNDFRVLPLKIRFLKIFAFIALAAALIVLYPHVKNLRHRSWQASNQVVIPVTEETTFSRAEVFKQTLRYLMKNYYDTKALEPRPLLKEALFGISRAVPDILVQFPEKGGPIQIEVGGQKKEISVPSLHSLEDILPVVQQAFAFIQGTYKGEIKFEDIQYAAINGMLDSLDPHSALLPPKIFSEFKTQTEGEFGGIGIVIGLKEGDITVIAPLPDTPAWRAGLKPKDKIIKIGEEASINMNLNEAVERLRGKVGTQVHITVAREGATAPLDYTLTRAKIKIESVQAKLIQDPQGDVGILKVKSFQEETMRELLRHLRAMKAKSKNFKGLVLDLRNNPGGLLNQAVDMANQFLESGQIVLTVGANNQILEVDEAHGSDKEEGYPIVIIVNDGSASASEIVSGALKNNNRAIVIGTQTFGKGSVQSVYSLKDGSALKMTVAQYLTPGKQSIQSVGITPDIKLLPETIEKDKVDIVESETFGEKDLEKHLESTFKATSKPIYSLGFYQKPVPEDEERQNYTSDILLEDDFPLQFAHRILIQTDAADREKMLKKVEQLVGEIRAQEDQKVQDALQKVGLDWSLGPAGEKPVAAVTFDIHSSGGQVVKAGEESELELKVHNIGKGPFYQLIAHTKCENVLLKNREFIFGKVAPGEMRSWKVKVKMPASAFRREDKVGFSFQEGNNSVPEDFQTVLVTEPLPRPSYSYSYQILDGGNPASRGNGNGKIEPGEKVVLKMKIKNVGPGLGKDSVVNIKNLDGEGIFISQGRQKLGEMPAGAEKEAELSFEIGKGYDKEKLEMELSIADMETQENLTDKFQFPITAGQLKPQPGREETAPSISLSKEPYPSRTNQKRITISGKVSDPTGLKDVSVFVDDNKAYLKTLPSPSKQENASKEVDFDATVTLKEGDNNLITVLARDENDHVTRKSFYILQE